ncbi:MAG: proline--tRNA ligase [Candidatus Omnitrophota bacterium]
MHLSKTLMPTLKENPSDAETISHKLMLRAGLIRKLSSGVYSYLPLGLKVLKKVEKIVREEMDKAGALEVLLPALQPVELWQQTGRFETLGQDLISFVDRHGKRIVLGPTHEEVITALVKNEVSSYKQLPLIIYQIQTKFRDEVRPRFGVIRCREFMMKDAYSFDTDVQGLDISYKKMYAAYCAILKRCGLSYIAVQADPGIMGGDESSEFMAAAEHGEDIVVHCTNCGYAASIAKAECRDPVAVTYKPYELLPMGEIETPGITSVADVSTFLKVELDKLMKTMLYITKDEEIVAVLVRGNYDVNEAKLCRILKTNNLKMADRQTIEKITNGEMGFSGPVGLKNVKIIADFSVKDGNNFITGANKKDQHLTNVNPWRDFDVHVWADVRCFTAQDLCPGCQSQVTVQRAIEVGHVFKLGTKYTRSLNAFYLDEQGRQNLIIMGCYGIGVSRIIAAVVEQNNDCEGIIWPEEIAPYQVVILPLNIDNKALNDTAIKIYNQLLKLGIDVLIDDRNERAGVKFKDADLSGIPLQVIIGENSLAKKNVEVKIRKIKEKIVVKQDLVIEEICKILKPHDNSKLKNKK